MKTTTTRKLLLALGSAMLLLTGSAAHADRDHWRDRDRDEWRHHKPHHDHRRWDPPGHRRYYDDRPVVIKERYIERPRYVDRDVYYYPEPPRRYYRDPAITIGVDVPPIVIPLR